VQRVVSRLRRAELRMHQKVRNLVDELHRKLARWLCAEFRVVLLPRFATQQMVVRGTRRIRSKTARALCTWSHCRFRQRLLDVAWEYPGCCVQLVGEAFTSKTCGACGAQHARLGGSKVFRCPAAGCGRVADRDGNGARNILLRTGTRLHENACGFGSGWARTLGLRPLQANAFNLRKFLA